MKKPICLAVVFLFGITCSAGIAASAQNQTLTLRKHIVIDRNGFGCEAFRLLVPKGWHFKGGVSWDYNKFPPEASTAFTITSLDGGSVFEQFTPINLFWSQDQNMQFSYSRAGMEILQPMGAIEFLKNFFIPHFRSNLSSVKVIQTQNLPRLAQPRDNPHHKRQSINAQLIMARPRPTKRCPRRGDPAPEFAIQPCRCFPWFSD